MAVAALVASALTGLRRPPTTPRIAHATKFVILTTDTYETGLTDKPHPARAGVALTSIEASAIR